MALANGVVALALLLGAGVAQSATVLCGTDLGTAMACGPGDTNAIGISNLEVEGVSYDVELKFEAAADTFTLPLIFDSTLEALAATSAVSDALNALPSVVTVNQLMSPPADPASKIFYAVPFEFRVSSGWSVRAAEYFPIAGGWQPLMEVGSVPTLGISSFAIFTEVSGQPATVPNVVDMTQIKAHAAILDAGLTVGESQGEPSETIAPGKVARQDPLAGEEVAEGSMVDLFISTGIPVPNVVGLTEPDAVAAITAAGLIVGFNINLPDGTQPAGHVFHQEPDADTAVLAGSKVSILVSTGTTMVSVPDVVGYTQALAEAVIKTNLLRVGPIEEEASSTIPEGSVVRQDPPGGESAEVRSEVALVVSLGAVETSVPDVVGESEADAITAIEAVGLVASVQTSSSDTTPEGHVISQNPVASTVVDVGSNVTIVVSTGGTPQTTVNFDPNDLTKAIGIDNLDVGGATYDVAFTTLEDANTVYGDFQDPLFDWERQMARDVADAINVELNLAGAAAVGAEELEEGQQAYYIGFDTILVGTAENLRSWFSDIDSMEWDRFADEESIAYNDDDRVFAVLVPEPGATLSLFVALATLGVVRRWRTGRERRDGLA